MTEYRDPTLVKALIKKLYRTAERPFYEKQLHTSGSCFQTTDSLGSSSAERWRIMEVCGGQTRSILRHGLDFAIQDVVELVHGPGCPVCVTSPEVLDRAIELSLLPGLTLCCFSDMLRVPGSMGMLLTSSAKNGSVHPISSPLEAVALAAANPHREVVLFAVGFETTAPTTAAAVLEAERQGVRNFTVYLAHVGVPPLLEAVLSQGGSGVDGVLAAGHVCTVMGIDEYSPLSERYRVPIVVTGFEPVDILHGLVMCVERLEEGAHGVWNQYARVVSPQGNKRAKGVLERVFERGEIPLRGFPLLPKSGLVFTSRYRHFDALKRFHLAPQQKIVKEGEREARESCRASEVLSGVIKPPHCVHFGRGCTPETPLGAPMVSAEGACAAYYRYRRDEGGAQ